MKIIRSSHFILCSQRVPTYSWRITFFSILILFIKIYEFTYLPPFPQQSGGRSCYCFGGTWWSPALTSLMSSALTTILCWVTLITICLFTFPPPSQLSCCLLTSWFGSCTAHATPKWWVMIRMHPEKYFPSRVIQG